MIKKIKNPALRNSRFIIVPKIKSDELIVSWFVRTSYAHQTHPHTFVKLHLNKSSQVLSSNNFDVCITNEDIKALEYKSNNKVSLFGTTLRSYNGYLQENIINNGLNKLLCPLRFCPICLKEDRVVYFRKKWRIIFNTVCEKHRCFLYDRCPNCNSFLDITKMYGNKLSFKFCYKCGFELSKSRKLPLNKKIMHGFKTVKNLNKILCNGYINFGKDLIYSFYFYDCLFQLSKKILKHKKNSYIKNRYLFKYLNLKAYSPSQPVLHQIPIKEQYALFSLCYFLFEKFPLNIKNYINKNKLSYWETLKDMDYVPFWFDVLINSLSPRLVPISKMLTKIEIENGKKHLKANGLLVSKVNMSRLFGCNFFSVYNKLEI